jgi:hypothetical protein
LQKLAFSHVEKFGYSCFSPISLQEFKNILTNFGFFPDNLLDLFGDVNNLLLDFKVASYEFPSTVIDYGCLFPSNFFRSAKTKTEEEKKVLTFFKNLSTNTYELPEDIIRKIAEHYLRKNPKFNDNLDL